MNLSSPFIKRPVMTSFVMLAIVLLGIMAYLKLPVSDLPIVSDPKIDVYVSYPGASPEVVLDEVTIPLEKELAEVKGVKEMTSTSSQGHAGITLQFDLNKNMKEAVQDLVAALNKAEGMLPDNASKPMYIRRENDKDPIMLVLLTSKTVSPGALRSIADKFLVPRLNRIEGIAQVKTFGPEKAIWLKVNPEQLASRNIGFNQIVETIESHTSQSALGTIQTSSKMLSLEIEGSRELAKKLEDLYIVNSNVKIKDVATIAEESAEDKEFHFVTQKEVLPTVALCVIKTNDANTVSISHEAQELVAALQKEVPPEVTIRVWFNKAEWIEHSILDVKYSLAIAFLLVSLVIYMSLGRFTDALIPSVALPLSLIGTFSVMYLLDYSIDLLSLLALTLSVGFVVDDAIVVLEAIVRFQEKGKKAFEASLLGSKQIAFTVLSMTLSLVAVFIPLLFMPGVNGKLFREFSVTLSVAILVSGFISLTLTPMLCSRYLSSEERKEKKSKMLALYERTLKKVLHYPKTVLAAACLLMAITVPLYMKLPVLILPPEDRGILITGCKLPSGLTSAEFKKLQQKLEGIFQGNPYVDSFFDWAQGDNLCFFTQLIPREKRPSQDEIIGMVQKSLDGCVGLLSFTQGFQLFNINAEFGSHGQYKYDLHGLDAAEVEKAALAVVEKTKKFAQFSYVDVSLKDDFPRLVIDINKNVADKLGLRKEHVQNLLQFAYGDMSIGTLQNTDIYMKLMPEYSNSIHSLSNLYFSQDEARVPLKAIASWREILSKPRIERHEQLPSASISFTLAPGVQASSALQLFSEEAKSALTPNVTGELTGAAKKITSAMSETLLLFLAAAIVMYIILGMLYESFIHPLTILSSLPFAGLGGIITLWLFNEPISIFSAVGFLLLLGIVKKNGIMMVDYAILAKSQGKSSHDAILEGCLARFRPIMMTTVAAIMGAIPIAIGLGDSAEMRRGLGLVIAGGLLFSQALTLYVTPVIYLAFDYLKNKRRV